MPPVCNLALCPAKPPVHTDGRRVIADGVADAANNLKIPSTLIQTNVEYEAKYTKFSVNVNI